MNAFSRLSRYAIPLAALVLVGQGCIGGSKPAAGPDGGVFRTVNAGQAWTQLKVLNLGTKIGSIANVGLATLAQDPQDPKALYAGTAQDGILVSLDGGESWSQSPGSAGGPVVSIAVDPKDKCTVYAARRNQIIKTDNCMRDWKQAYFDPRTDKAVTAVMVDWFNPSVVYAATNDGDILRSDDRGAAWRVAHRVAGTRVNNLAMDPTDSRVVYASLFGKGVAKTVDGGASWVELRDPLNSFDGARRTNFIALDPNTKNRVYHASKYGVLISDDGAATWTALSLPTPPGTTDVKAFAVHPKDARQLVYATDKSVVISKDGGLTWTPAKLPTARPPAVLMYGMSEGYPLYLGPAQPPEKK